MAGGGGIPYSRTVTIKIAPIPNWRVRLMGLFIFLVASQLVAQENPPKFQSQSNLVLVPAGVYGKNGNFVYGLTAKDFVIEDGGVEQSVMLDDSVDSNPVSVVLAVHNRYSQPEVDQS